MEYDPRTLDPRQTYKLLSGAVVPRPIAFVSTQSSKGVPNAAPFSFFNVVSGSPPMVCVSVGTRSDGSPKDTARNIDATGEFVVNIVDEPLAERMNQAATDFPPDMSEFDVVPLTPARARRVRAPRIAESPVQLECVLYQSLSLKGSGNTLYIGEVVWFHMRDDVALPEHKVDPEKLRAVGRLAGNEYTYVRDLFQLDRMQYAEWRKRHGE